MRAESLETLPGAEIALDLDAFLAHLNAAFEASGEAACATRGRIVDVQYKPGRTCLVMYRLGLVNRSTGRSSRWHVAAELPAPGEQPTSLSTGMVERYRLMRRRPTTSPEFHLANTPIVVRPFPLDAAMPWLVDAIEPESAKYRLSETWRPQRLRVRSLTSRVLGYTPHARATIRYGLEMEDRDTGDRTPWNVVGKTHFYKAADRLFADAWGLWRAVDGRVRLAEPLGFSGPLRMTFQRQVEGQRLNDFAGSDRFIALVQETASALATIHTVPAPLSSRRVADSEVRGVARWSEVLATISPDLAVQVASISDRLTDLLLEQFRPAGPVHGDFHPANVLTDGCGVTFIDLDEMAYGDPLLDVGRFLASLRVSAMRVTGHPSGLATAEEAFLTAYLRDAPAPEARARLYEAASLLIAAATPFRLQRAGWQESAAMLIDEADRMLSLAEKGRSAGVATAPKPAMPLDDRLGWACDGRYMQARLHPHLAEAFGANVTGCRVGRPRPTDDGYRLRYSLSGSAGDERWHKVFYGRLSAEPRGGGLHRRLTALRASLEAREDAPYLPRPIAQFSDLSLIVWDVPKGTAWTSLLDAGDGPRIADALGRGLAAIHSSDASIDKVHAVQDELRSVYQRAKALKARCASAGREALRVHHILTETGIPELGEAAVVLRGVALNDLSWLDDRIAIGTVRDIVRSHPMIDVGDLLARLRLLALESGNASPRGDVAERILASYRQHRAIDHRALAFFEAMALVRLSCRVAERPDRIDTATDLVRQAASLAAALASPG